MVKKEGTGPERSRGEDGSSGGQRRGWWNCQHWRRANSDVKNCLLSTTLQYCFKYFYVTELETAVTSVKKVSELFICIFASAQQLRQHWSQNICITTRKLAISKEAFSNRSLHYSLMTDLFLTVSIATLYIFCINSFRTKNTFERIFFTFTLLRFCYVYQNISNYFAERSLLFTESNSISLIFTHTQMSKSSDSLLLSPSSVWFCTV